MIAALVLIALIGAMAAILLLVRARGLLSDHPQYRLVALAARLRRHTEIYRPEGAGPFPAIILLHGCGGPRGLTERYGRLAAANNVIAIAPDSLALRGIDYEAAVKTVCTGARLRAPERAGDVLAALEIARRDPRVDSRRIAIAGWSHGAWTLLDLLTLVADGKAPTNLFHLPHRALRGVRAALVFYPYSGFPARSRIRNWARGVPVEAILVEGDMVCDETQSVAVFERQRAAGAEIDWQVWSGVTHGFDEDNHLPGSGLVFHPEKVKAAEAAFTDFLKRRLIA
ncbi:MULTISPECIES: dienelactone hydrolase family protein [Hyphobacterium]|uniref:Dienelactone hydrolase family protein n=1 Tax=Hyphobacterium vulgare TaxID=1736751 RepID=A0ABV6ZXY4_9PROT